MALKPSELVAELARLQTAVEGLTGSVEKLVDRVRTLEKRVEELSEQTKSSK